MLGCLVKVLSLNKGDPPLEGGIRSERIIGRDLGEALRRLLVLVLGSLDPTEIIVDASPLSRCGLPKGVF